MPIRPLAAALAVLTIMPSLAQAADIGGFAPLRGSLVPVQAQSGGDWTGFHMGLTSGYEWLDISGFDAESATIGIYGGYNYQIGRFVLGAETDFQLTSPHVQTAIDDFEQFWAGSLRARVGVAAEAYMAYLTGGLAYSRGEYGVPLAGESDKRTHFGWTIGGGVEALLARNLTGRLEYRYADYGSETYTLAIPITNAVIGERLSFDTHTVLAGIGYRF